MASASISVQLVSEEPRTYRLAVRVRERGGETTHIVTLGRDLLARLAPSAAPEDFVKRCFAFLLERESKESILGRFDVSVIGHYFPDFEEAIAEPSRSDA